MSSNKNEKSIRNLIRLTKKELKDLRIHDLLADPKLEEAFRRAKPKHWSELTEDERKAQAKEQAEAEQEFVREQKILRVKELFQSIMKAKCDEPNSKLFTTAEELLEFVVKYESSPSSVSNYEWNRFETILLTRLESLLQADGKEEEPTETDQGSLQEIIEILKNWHKSEKTNKDFEAAKSALPPVAKTYDILCRTKGQCGAKTTDIIRWLGTAARDNSGYYRALFADFASPEVIADLEQWQEQSAETGQDKKSDIGNATEPTVSTRYERYIRYFKEHKVFSIILVVAIIIIAFGYFTDALEKIRNFWFKSNSSPKLEMNVPPTSDKTLSKLIVVASATVEVKITSDWDFNGTVPYTKVYLAFVKGDKPLLITSSIGYTASQTGNDEVVYKAKLDMDAKDSAVGNPTSFLKDAEYIQIEFDRMPPNSSVLGGDAICIINNSVRLEFSIPPQKLVNNRIFIRNLSESLHVLTEPGN